MIAGSLGCRATAMRTRSMQWRGVVVQSLVTRDGAQIPL